MYMYLAINSLILQGFSRLASRIHAYEVSSIPIRIFMSKISSNPMFQLQCCRSPEEDYSTVVEMSAI